MNSAVSKYFALKNIQSSLLKHEALTFCIRSQESLQKVVKYEKALKFVTLHSMGLPIPYVVTIQYKHILEFNTLNIG